MRHKSLDYGKFKSGPSSFGYEPRFERDFMSKRFKERLVVMNGNDNVTYAYASIGGKKMFNDEKKFATKHQIMIIVHR